MNTATFVEGYLTGEVQPEPDDHNCNGRHCAVCEFDNARSKEGER